MKHDKETMENYTKRLKDYMDEELQQYDSGITDEWNDARKKSAEVLGYKLSGTSDINEIKVGSVYKDKQGNKYKVIKHLYGDQWQLTHTSDKKISFQTDEYSIGKTYKLVKEINNIKEDFGGGGSSHFNAELKKWSKKYGYKFDYKFKKVRGKTKAYFVINVDLETFNKNSKAVMALNKLTHQFNVDYSPTGKTLTVETKKRDYKAEYKKYGSSTKSKKYRAELNKYNRQKGTYGNGDGKDASHKGGKIVGFENESKNRGRKEKSRLKKKTSENVDMDEQKIREMIQNIVVDEGFAGGLKKEDRKKFNKNRQKQSEVLGYELAGKNDIKTSIGDATVTEGKLTEGKYDKILDKIEDLVKGANNFMGVGKVLKKAGIKYIFSTNMMPMYKLSKIPIAILNKKYVDKSDRTVGDIAIGVIGEGKLKEAKKRDYKDEYKKFQSSDKSKKYRAELNKYNRQKGTYGNGDGKDASHKGGKIVGFEAQSKNRGRAEKSRLRKEISTADRHQKKIAIDTLKNPFKGKFLGGMTAKEAEKVLRDKFKYTNKQISKLKESINEGKWSKIMTSVRKGSKAGPWSIVVYKNKKVLHQRLVKILQQIPAQYEDVKKKFPNASIGIEDKYGERVYTESINEAKELYKVVGIDSYLNKVVDISMELPKAKAKSLLKTILKQQKDSGMDIFTKLEVVPIKESINEGKWAVQHKKNKRYLSSKSLQDKTPHEFKSEKEARNMLVGIDWRFRGNYKVVKLKESVESKLRNMIREEIQLFTESTEFIVFYNRKQHKVKAKDLYTAKKEFISKNKIPKSKQGIVAVMSKKAYDDQQFRYESVDEDIEYISPGEKKVTFKDKGKIRVRGNERKIVSLAARSNYNKKYTGDPSHIPFEVLGVRKGDKPYILTGGVVTDGIMGVSVHKKDVVRFLDSLRSNPPAGERKIYDRLMKNITGLKGYGLTIPVVWFDKVTWDVKKKKTSESINEANTSQIKKKLLKQFGKDPLYKDVIMAKNTKEMKKAMDTLKSIRGGNALVLMQKYAKKITGESINEAGKSETKTFKISGEVMKNTKVYYPGFNTTVKTPVVNYKIRNFQEPISKKMLLHIKKELGGDYILKTNAGVELHSKELRNNTWKGIKVLRMESNGLN